MTRPETAAASPSCINSSGAKDALECLRLVEGARAGLTATA